jgi:hypothetical protein
MAGWSEGHLQEDGSQGRDGITSIGEDGQGWRSLLSRTYALYRRRFWAFFRMAFLPGFLAYLFSQAARFWIRPFLRPLLDRLLVPRGSIYDLDRLLNPPLYTYFLNTGNILAFLEGTFYWFLSAFLLAAVATEVLDSEESSGVLADSYTRARDRLGPIFVVSLLVWTCYTVSRVTAGFAVGRIILRFQLGPLSASALFLLPGALICGLLSRLGLAIPALINDLGSSFSSAVRTSVRKTENWEPFFILFVIKSAIAGYAVFWLANRGLDWLWQRGIVNATLDPWVSRIIYICITAALETPLFIAFSILYRDTITGKQSLPAAG